MKSVLQTTSVTAIEQNPPSIRPVSHDPLQLLCGWCPCNMETRKRTSKRLGQVLSKTRSGGGASSVFLGETVNRRAHSNEWIGSSPPDFRERALTACPSRVLSQTEDAGKKNMSDKVMPASESHMLFRRSDRPLRSNFRLETNMIGISALTLPKGGRKQKRQREKTFFIKPFCSFHLYSWIARPRAISCWNPCLEGGKRNLGPGLAMTSNSQLSSPDFPPNTSPLIRNHYESNSLRVAFCNFEGIWGPHHLQERRTATLKEFLEELRAKN